MPETLTDTPLLTERFDRAMRYALDHHRRQLRKGSGIPYASHLLAVTAIVLEFGGTEDEAIGGLLHDVVEDGGGPPALAHIEREFGAPVAAIVDANTDAYEEPKSPWHERKAAYIASIAGKERSALLVSLADKLHNATAILRDLRAEGDDVWTRFKTGSGPAVRGYYRGLVDAFAARADDIGPLGAAGVAELRRVVDEIDRLSGEAG